MGSCQPLFASCPVSPGWTCLGTNWREDCKACSTTGHSLATWDCSIYLTISLPVYRPINAKLAQSVRKEISPLARTQHLRAWMHTMSLLAIGNIPARLTELPLRTLRLQHNKLTSRIPVNMLSSPDLIMLSMSNNLLTGPPSVKLDITPDWVFDERDSVRRDRFAVIREARFWCRECGDSAPFDSCIFVLRVDGFCGSDWFQYR